MKHFTTCLFALLLMVTCKQEDALFSCDPILNEYVTTHFNELKTITISSLASSDLIFQHAVYSSFDPAKKREVWIQKIQQILVTQNYNAQEYAHVSSLLNQLSENYFVQPVAESEAQARKVFSRSWIAFAKNSLGWTDKQIAFVVFRLYTEPNQFENELKIIPPAIVPNGGELGINCYCNTQTDFCTTISCKLGNCKITTGCGWFWSETCDGTCI